MAIDLLHSLVHSLSKSERRYCRLLASQQAGEKGFIRLLDCLLDHPTPGEALLNDLTNCFPMGTLEPARKYLYKVLMRGLRQFEQDKRVDVRLAQLVHDSQILIDRGLVQAGREVLERAQRIAEQYERSLYAVLIARQQIEQAVRFQFDGMDEGALAGQHNLIQQQLERTQTALSHAALYETLLLRYQRQGEVSSLIDTQRLNDLLLEEYQLLNQQKHKSFAMKQQHLHFQSAYFRMVGDVQSSLLVYRELDSLFQQHTSLWAEQPLYYVQLLEGILHDLRRLERYEDMAYFTDRLRAINTPSVGLQQYVQMQLFTYTLLSALDQGHDGVVEQLLLTYQSELARAFEQLPLLMRLNLELALTRAEVRLNRLSDGLRRVRHLLDQPVRSLPTASYRQSLLLSLLIHARLQNADYLSYALRSVSRRVKREGWLNRVESIVLTLLTQWLDGRLATDALSQLISVTHTPAERQLSKDLELRSWLQTSLKRSH